MWFLTFLNRKKVLLQSCTGARDDRESSTSGNDAIGWNGITKFHGKWCKKEAWSHRARPVLPLDVSESMHDEIVTVLVDGGTLEAGVGRLGDFGSLTAGTTELL